MDSRTKEHGLHIHQRTRRLPHEVRDFLAENLGEDWNGIVPDDYFTDENWRTIRNLRANLSIRDGLRSLGRKSTAGRDGRTSSR